MTTTTSEAVNQTAPESTVDKKMLVHMSMAMAGISVLIAAATFIVIPIAQAAHAVHGG